MRCGRSICIHRDAPVSNVETTISSKRPGCQTSWTATIGSASPSTPSDSIPASRSARHASSIRVRAASRSDHSTGARSVTWTGPWRLRSSRARRRSGEPTVWFATTRRCVLKAMPCLRGCGSFVFRLNVPLPMSRGNRAGRIRTWTSAGPPWRALAQCVREPPRDPRRGRPALLLPQRHDDELLPRAVEAAHEDERAVDQVADVDRAARGARAVGRHVAHAAGVPRPRHPRHDLRPRVDLARASADTLAEALRRVLGDGDEDGQRARRPQKSRCSRPTTGDCGSEPTRRIASSTPGMNDVRSVESWRIVSVWPTSPRMTSWWATRPGRRTEWIGTSPSISSAVRAAVPLGASSLRSWCSSMISARRMYCDACAAKRIISTAPIAKFGATKTLPPPPSPASSAGSQPVVPTTACTPARTQARAFAEAVPGTVKSTTTSQSRRISASSTPSAGSARPVSAMSSAPSTASQTVCPMRPAAPATPTRMGPDAGAVLIASAPDGGRRRPWSSKDALSRDRLADERRRDGLDRAAERGGVGADAGGAELLRREQVAGEHGDVVERDGVDALDHLVYAHQRHVGEDGRAEAVHPRRRRLERQHDPALDVLLRAGELVGARRVLAHALELVGDDRHRPHDVVRPRAQVQADLARAGVHRLERVDVVGEPAPLADLLEQPRRRRAAEDVVEHAQREAAIVVARDARRAEADVVLLGLLGDEAHPRRLVGRRRRQRRGRRAGALDAGRAHELDERVVVDRAGRRDDDVRRHVARRVECPEGRRDRTADDLGAADDRAPERVVAEDGLAEHVEDLVLRVVLVHGDLLEHDLALLLELALVEARAPDHVGHHVEGLGEVDVEHARVHRRRLLAGARVELGAHRVEQLVDLERLVARRPAEQHVLDEVRQAGLGPALGGRARADPEAERHGSHGVHVLRDDPDARLELRQAVLFVHFAVALVALGVAVDAAAVARAPGAAGPTVTARAAVPGAAAAAARATVAVAAAARAAVTVAPGAAAVAAPAADRGELLLGLAGDVRVVGEAQADAAALAVDLDHAHGDLVALVEHLLDRRRALARGDVRDVQQAVGALGELDERAERGRLDDLAGVRVADLDLLGHRADPLGERVAQLAAARVDQDLALVVDVDLGLELVLQGTDRLAALADEQADLVRVGLDGEGPRRVGRELGPRLGDRVAHLAEDRQARVLRLRQRVAQDLEGHAGDLDVHLEGGDAVLGAGDLEVHVAEVVLDAGDVGEDGVVVALLDEPHRDARDRLADRHAGVHQGQRGAAHRRHRRRAVGLEDVRHDADRVREVLGARDHRDERALGERPVADVTALRAAHEAGLAHRERREVVVVPVELLRLEPEGVEAHLLLQRAERGDGQRLRLAAGEEGRAVRARRDPDLDRDRPDLALGAAVGAALVPGDALADHRLLDPVERELRALAVLGVRLGLGIARVLHEHGLLDRLRRVLPRELVLDLGRLVELRAVALADLTHQVLVDLRRGGGGPLPAGPFGPLALERAELLDLAVGDVEGVEHLRLGDLVGARLDHQDRLVRAGHDEVEVGVVDEVGLARVDDEVALDLADAHGADRRRERDRRDHQRGGRAVHREDVVGMLVVDAQRHVHELRLVVPALREERADRTVDHARGQGALLTGTTLALEEGAGDLARGVHALLDIHRQGEEVHVAEVADGRGAEDHRVALADDDSAGGLPGHLAGLERDLLAGDLDGDRRHGVTAHMCCLSGPARRSAGRFVLPLVFRT